MGLFGAIVRTTVNVALLPVAVVKDVVLAPVRAADFEPINKSTAEQIERIKAEADE